MSASHHPDKSAQPPWQNPEEAAWSEQTERLLKAEVEQLQVSKEESRRLLALAEQSRRALLSVLEDEQKAAIRAQDREGFIQDVINSLTAHVVVLDGQGRIVAVNRAWERFAAANNAPPMLKSYLGENYLSVCADSVELDGNTDARAALSGIRSVLYGLVPVFNMEYPCHGPGEERWFLMRVTPLTGGREGVVVSHENITDRKLAEEVLKRQTEELDQYFNNALDLFCITDMEGRFRRLNRAWESTLGHSLEELAERPFMEFVHPDDREATAEAMSRLRGRQRVDHFVNRYRRKDGGYSWIEWRAEPVGDLVYAAARDVTGRRKAAEEIRLREERFRLLIEHGSDLITVIDVQGVIQFQSPSVERLLGYQPEAVVNRSLFDYVHPEDTAPVSEAVQRALLSPGAPMTENCRLRHANGTWRAFQSIGRSFQDESDQWFVVINSRDITDRMALEQQYRQAQKMEAVGRLAGGVAHDFNNILAAIMMQTDLLKTSGELSAGQSELADEINQSARRAAALTRQLLMFSRRQPLQPRDMDLNEMVGQVIKMLKRILGEDIQIRVNLFSEPLHVHADPGMMDQVLLNLAVNARDAMPRGGTLTIETESVLFDEQAVLKSTRARPGWFACLSVGDTGCGIAPELLSQIFEPFFTTKSVGKGTGLGLATLFGIVEQHEGWIEVQSELGQGSTFRVYLPRSDRQPDYETTMMSFDSLPGGNETILFVEDDPSLRVLVRAALKRLGYHVLEAPTGATAIEVWNEHREEIRLLLTDMVMPDGISGKELASRLKQEAPSLKVIYASGYSVDLADKELKLQEGVNFLSKPFQAQKLALTIRRALDGD